MLQTGETHCSHCGCLLTRQADRRYGVCSRIECRGPYLQQQRDQHRKRQARQIAKDSLGDKAADVSLMIVPFSETKLVPVTEAYRDEFESNLRSFIQAGSELARDKTDPDEFGSQPEESEANLIVINACSTCQGHCCRNGRGHAYFTDQFFAWRLTSASEHSSETIADEYLQLIPEEHVEDSCIFHGREGCVLPREIRSFTCNEYLCKDIVNGIETTPRGESSIAVSATRDSFRRVAIIDESGNRSECSLTLTEESERG